MDAPTYPPAAAYEAPRAMPVERLQVRNVSIAELQTSPAAWAIVMKHAPGVKMIAQAPQTKAYLTNFTVDTFALFGVVSPKAIAAIDADLAVLPRSQWPAL